MLTLRLPLHAQIFAPKRDWAGVTKYVQSAEYQDSIFTFFADNTPTLIAHDSTATFANFVWLRFNSDSLNFVDTVFVEADVDTSRVDSLPEGGYRVQVTAFRRTVHVFERSVTMGEGAITLIANVLPLISDQNVTWTIVSGAEHADLTSAGEFTPKSAGVVQVRATSAKYPALLGEGSITIDPALTNPGDKLCIDSLCVEPDTVRLLVGETAIVKVTQLFPNNINRTSLLYVIEDELVAKFNGNLLSALAPGETKVVVKPQDGDYEGVTIPVFVYNPDSSDPAKPLPQPAPSTVSFFTAWVFVDNVLITSIEERNSCECLELRPKTSPNRYDVEYERFVYFDLSLPRFRVKNDYGLAYFSAKNVKWEAKAVELDKRVEVPDPPGFDLLISDPPPLYDAQYTISFTSPFGRKLSAQTTVIQAIAVQAKQQVKINNFSGWVDYEPGTGYEALLELSLSSKAINADSVFWRLSKKDLTTFDYNEFWRDSAEFGDGEIFPDKQLLTPGDYHLFHLAKNVNSLCVDSLMIDIRVDSSMLKPEAIPNVFTPTNRDGTNDVFNFISPDENIRSMKTCKVLIYSRSGSLVHKYEGDPREWLGWNGNVLNSNRLASPGVYFYIIEAVGWDGHKFKRGPYKGTLHLF